MSLRELLMVYSGEFADIYADGDNVCCARHSWNMLSEDILNRGVKSIKPSRSDNGQSVFI